jgi:hypothetical protein
MARELPRGTVTFLFTDIEGSTRLLKRLGDGYADVLRQHQGLLRAAFEADKGGGSGVTDAASERHTAPGRDPRTIVPGSLIGAIKWELPASVPSPLLMLPSSPFLPARIPTRYGVREVFCAGRASRSRRRGAAAS